MQIVIALIFFAFAGCSSGLPIDYRSSKPVKAAEHKPSNSRANNRLVIAGDTLYSIAWSCGCEIADLVKANNLAPPYTIYPGQYLALPSRTTKRKVYKAIEEKSISANWSWPAQGKVLQSFGDGNQGVDYVLAKGSSISATSSGEVVYSGSGLGGYRYLIIIKHTPAYLSAYSLNIRTLVEEGQQVKGGEILVSLNTSKRGDRLCHFEIRRNGVAINPELLITK